MRYAANPDMAANELNKPVVKQEASFLQQVAQNVGAVVADLRASDNSYVRSVGDKLATNASQLGELAKGLTTTLTSPVELFNAIAFGDPNNPLSKWASSVRNDVTAAQAAVDPEWQKTKAYLNEQLTNIGADRGQIDQAIATIDMYANNPRAIGDLIANTIPTIIPGLGAYTALRTVGAGATAAYMGGAFTAATTSQTDLIEMADRTYENILKQVKAENPSLTESEAQVKAAAGAAMSMRGAGIISLAGSTALQLLPGSQLNNVLVKAVTREIGQEVGDELWVKAISNAWQGKPLQADMGRATIEAVVASGPIAGAAQLLSTQTGNTYNQDNVIRDLTWEVAEGKPTFDKGVKLLTGPNNEVIYNSANQPILLTYTEKPGLTLATDPDASGPSPMDRNVSDPAESLFDIIFDNEKNGGYYVNSVDLDGNSYTVTDRDGVTQVINTDSLLNKALDVITQNNPQEVTFANPIEQLLTDAFARSINLEAATGTQTTGNIVAVNPKGAFVNTRSGDIVFVPTTQTNQTVTLSDLKYGDSVVLVNGYVAPITKEVNTNGQESIVLDGSRLNTNLGVSFVTAANPATVTFQNLTGQEVTIDRTQLPTGVDYNTGALFYANTLPFVFDQTSGLAKDSLQITPSPINLTPGTGFDFSLGPIDLTTGSIPSSVPGLVPSLIPAPSTDALQVPPDGEMAQPPALESGPSYPAPSVLTPPVTPPPVDQPPIIINTPSTPPVVNPPGLVPPTPPTVPVTTIQPPPVPPATFTPPVDLMPPSGLTPPDIPLSGVPSTTINVGGSPTIKVPPVVTTRPPPVTIVPTGGTPTTPPTWGYPNVPPPELPPYEPMPYPNYLRPLTPYLPLGIGALMEAMYAQEQGNGRYQPIQNAGGYFKIPT